MKTRQPGFETLLSRRNAHPDPGLRVCGAALRDGLVLDNSEGERLVKVMGGKRVLLHQNHGVIVCGNSVAEAFDDLYYLERACQVQILAQSTGKELCLVKDDVVGPI